MEPHPAENLPPVDWYALSTHGITPDVIDAQPNQLVKIDFGAVPVQLGTVLKPNQTALVPTASFDAVPDKFYTLIHIDPDALSRSMPIFKSVLHWLVVNAPGGDITRGDHCVEYRGSGAPPFTGVHRYIFLVYEQPGRLELDDVPRSQANSWSGRMRFNVRKFAGKYNLGEPIAVNFYCAKYNWR